jgi:hypothetical protein
MAFSFKQDEPVDFIALSKDLQSEITQYLVDIEDLRKQRHFSGQS